MNCQEALSLLYEIIDKEASDVDTEEVQRHLQKCRHCFEVYRLEQSIQEFINHKINDGPSEGVHEDLRSRVLQKLDEVDADGAEVEPDRRSHRPFRLPAAILVAAAALVVLLGATLVGSRFLNHQSQYIPLEKSHLAMTAEPAGFSAPSPELADLVATTAKEYHYELEPAIGQFELRSGRPETIMDTPMIHYLYADDDRHVSVFVAPAEWFERHFDDDMTPVNRSEGTVFDHNCRGCRLVFHRVGDTVVITASREESVDLLEFMPGHVVI